MAIYLDANALYGWHSFGELDRLALSVVARQLGQPVVLPRLVVDEAAHKYRQSLQGVIDAHAKSVKKLGRYFGVTFTEHLEPLPDIDDAEDSWRRRLGQWATTIETTGDDALGGLHREIHRIRPAKDSSTGCGAGGRDAAIWLTVSAHHRQSDQPGHLITKDKAFADDGHLHPRLVADIVDSQPMRLYTDVSSFVARLGRYADANIRLGDLTQRGAAAIRKGLEFSTEVGDAVWSEYSIPYRQRNDITAARAVGLISARDYSSGDSTITLVNAQWRVVADLLWQTDSVDEATVWNVLSDITLAGQIQLYIDDDRAQMIGAQLKSPISASIHGDRVRLIGSPLEMDSP